MGMTLCDRNDTGPSFSINYWHWRAIVEAVRRLGVLPEETVDGLHQPFCGNGLTDDEARRVASAIERDLLPTLQPAERLLLDGDVTAEPDDGHLHREQVENNYSTNREVLERFVAFCRACAGFDVN